MLNMATHPKKLTKIEGASFTKLMGSGGGHGFAANPNFGVYALLIVWEDQQSADNYFRSSKMYKKQKKQSVEQWHLFFKGYKSRGSWGGLEPFELNTEYSKEAPIVVITRAAIKTRHILKFWKKVPDISAFLQTQESNLFSVGVGETPWFYQVTFSLWENEEKMIQFAHKDKNHAEAAKKSLDYGWFKEELFARFHLVKSSGTWNGANPASNLGLTIDK